jgi:hypothetical protein
VHKERHGHRRHRQQRERVQKRHGRGRARARSGDATGPMLPPASAPRSSPSRHSGQALPPGPKQATASVPASPRRPGAAGRGPPGRRRGFYR